MLPKNIPPQAEIPKPTWKERAKNFFIGKEDTPEAGALANIDLMDVEPVSTSILLGGNSEARSRQQIYAKYQQMQQNSFINAGLRLSNVRPKPKKTRRKSKSLPIWTTT